MQQKTKLTVIVDNIPQEPLKGEWGLSILVEYGEQKILVDVGGSGLFLENMRQLGFSVEDVDFATLSHAHYDHGNGMIPFFQQNKKAKFYLRAGAKENCYAKKFIFKVYIGIPRKILTGYADRIVLASGDYKVCDGVYLIPHKTPGLEKVGIRENMYQKIGHKYMPDDFSHEQSLVLDTEKGLVIINSCCHGGAVNVVREVMETFPDKKVYGLIGGFHLHNKSQEEILEVSKNLREIGVEYVCTGHCTGNRAFNIMKAELGDMVEQLHVGLTMEF